MLQRPSLNMEKGQRRSLRKDDDGKEKNSYFDENVVMPPPMELLAMRKSEPTEYMADKYWKEIIAVFENTYVSISHNFSTNFFKL